ncbi:MAG TPA: hypothetical protein VM553_07875 [Dongiaceae bacterium]|nr:hypothetical protein [Dongiaceae bacterium]
MGKLANHYRILAGVGVTVVVAAGIVLLAARLFPADDQALMISSGPDAMPATAAVNASQPLPAAQPTPQPSPQQILVNAQWALASADAALYEAEQAADDSVATDQDDSTGESHRLDWSFTTDSERKPPFQLDSQIRDFSMVAVESKPAYVPTPGEQVVVPMLDGKEVTVDVKSSKVMENGDYTWSGHLQGYDTDYPVVMTYGKTSTFATITTPEGAYSMQAVNGTGWLYKNPSEAELSGPGQDDFLEPSEGGATEQQHVHDAHVHEGDEMAIAY